MRNVAVSRERFPWRVLYLNNNLLSSLKGLSWCAQLVKLDLSHNRLADLPDKGTWASLPQLEVLFLHCNKLEKIQDLKVFGMFALRVLVPPKFSWG